MITLTENAKNQILGLEINNLRVQVTGGGCSGLSYKLDSIKDEDIVKHDQVIDFDKFVVVIDAKSALFIKGMVLDYQGGLNGQGFSFTNPNAKRTCGCGSSFGV